MLSKVPYLILVLVIGFFLLVAAYIISSHNIDTEINSLTNGLEVQPPVEITESSLTTLPGPVKRYLEYSRVVGKALPSLVTIKQKGNIRSEKSGWQSFQALEYYSTTPPAFVWRVSMPSNNVPLVFGRDSFTNGKGSILIKALSIAPLVQDHSEKIDEAAMMRYLNEMMWFPQAYLGSNVSWKAIDDSSAEVSLIAFGKNVSATMYFSKEGKLTNFVAKRYYSEDKTVRTWSTPIEEYGEFEGIRIPVKGKGVWKLDNGDFEYIKVTISELNYY
jgi:hypothetical protein